MTTTYGLSDVGFLPEPLSQLRADLEAAMRGAFGASLSLGDRSIFGQIVGIIAERLADLWSNMERVNSSQDPDKATGASLDALCALTGTARPPATFSAVTLTLTGTPATVVPLGTAAATASTAKNFALVAAATITVVPTWVTATIYSVGNRVTNGGSVYQCTVGGTSSGGPTGIDPTALIADGTVTWTWLGLGTGAIDALANAQVTGVIEGFARDITVRINQVAGWSSVTNLLDAAPGRDVASDGVLRQLRVAELSGDGETTLDAITAALLSLTDVTSCTVFVNNTDFTDANGTPPHSIAPLVEIAVGATFDQEIWDTLLANVAAGILTFGTSIGTSVDSQGNPQTMAFSRPTAIPIYVRLVVLKDLTYPGDGDAEVADAVATWGQNQAVGKDVVASAIVAQAFSVQGVLDVQAFIDVSPSPTLSVTIPISLRQLATYDTSRISVTSTTGTP